jgi:hypothetical protein
MPPPRRFLPAAKTEFTERTIHNLDAINEYYEFKDEMNKQMDWPKKSSL